MFFGMLTIDNDGFSMVLGLSNHWFQWFSMVKDHWSNDGMVSMDRTGLNADMDPPEVEVVEPDKNRLGEHSVSPRH